MALQMDHYRKMVRQGLDPKGSVQQERDVAKGSPHKPVEIEGTIEAMPGIIEDWTVEDIVDAEMEVTSEGNVGIGTSPPPVEMVIEDTGHLRIGDESPSEALHIVTEGSIGIMPKDWEPTAKLHVETAPEILERLVTEIGPVDTSELDDMEVVSGVNTDTEVSVVVKPKKKASAKKKAPAKKKSTVKKKKSTKKV